MLNNKKLSFAIIGYGRFGELLAKSLEPFGDVYIISRRKVEGMKQIEYKDLDKIDVIIPAVPISKFEEVVKEISPYLKKGSLIMDVCSVKEIPCQIMKKYVPEHIEILGTHPMFGPDSAKDGLKGLQVVMCPLRISDNLLNEIKSIFTKMGLQVIMTTPAEHDQQAARCLALVHFLGRGLSGMEIEEQNISSVGYDRLLAVNKTVKNDTWELFFDMHHFNPYSDKARKDLMHELESLDKEIVEKIEKNKKKN